MSETLAEWSRKTGIVPSVTNPSCRTIVIEHDHPARARLWHLADYALSTSAGKTLHLVPKVVELNIRKQEQEMER